MSAAAPHPRVVVVGAGVGGLAAALRLRQLGHEVTVLEARTVAGGLASAVEAEGATFDGGPYILLDRPGLAWAYSALGLDVSWLPLRRLEQVYTATVDGQSVALHADLDQTACAFDAAWPGSSGAYRAFVARASAAYDRLSPALRVDHPGPAELIRGGWRALPYILRTLGAVLRGTGLPAPARETLAIWTRIAGHDPEAAPGFMALVPALVHRVGAYACAGGLAAIPDAVLHAARAAGVEVRLGTPVRAIHHDGRAVRGVETADGERLDARLVVSDVGLSTYLSLLTPRIEAAARGLASLPLQSPGGCAYLLARGRRPEAYLRFRLDGGRCRLLVSPSTLGDGFGDDFPLRLIAPLDHAEAQRLGPEGQQAWLEALVAEGWWRDGLTGVRVAATRTPVTWGREFSLHRDAMNPVMTPGLARRGRLAHRSPWLRGLYLAGSATHPGQWVSFCCISGVLAAERAHGDAAC